ncbi:hypothetical protein ACFFQF_19405 [Haladaptatus pallidirubidus]|uniref:hypothetical protein n=1 Tax=Haladaptatus pallidirubidus TaxID=1008152 RepID=UPI0035EDEEF0
MASTHTQQSVTVFNTTVSAEEAEQTLLETDTDMAETTADRLVYYPYRVFGFDLHAEAFQMISPTESTVASISAMARRYSSKRPHRQLNKLSMQT